MDLIDRKVAIEAIAKQSNFPVEEIINICDASVQDENGWIGGLKEAILSVVELPSAQPEKEISKRVRWSGWKGHRYTRYYCPNCEKPVRNDDCYCHRCGQKLMFPKISFSDYVPGEKQQTIVTWEDENE